MLVSCLVFYIINTIGLFIHNHCATVTIWYAVRGLDRAGGALCEKPYRIAWMNMKWINIHIAEMHSHRICGTDVYVTPCTLYPPTHGGHRNARSLPTIQNKREFAGGRWGMRVGSGVDGGELELRWGNFSPVIALSGTSPGGTMTAAEGRHIMIYCPRSPWPKCQTQLMKIWHIVQRPRGRCTKAYSSFAEAGLQIHCLFPKMIIWFIERCGAKAS